MFLNFHKTLPFFFKFENNTFFKNILSTFKKMLVMKLPNGLTVIILGEAAHDAQRHH
jgi:hypothetical protein